MKNYISALASLFCIICFMPERIFSQSNVEIKLVLKKGNGPFSGGRTFGNFVDDPSNFSVDSGNYKIWGVWKFTFDFFQSAYNRFLRGKKTDSNLLRAYNFERPDLAVLIKENFDNSKYVFVGIKKNGRYVVIPDINDNRNFLDDSVYEYRNTPVPSDSIKILTEKLPIQHLRISTWNKEHLQDRDIFVKFIPKKYFPGLTMNLANTNADSLIICAEVQNHWEGSFNVLGKEYTVYLQNSFPDTRFAINSQVVFFIAEKHKRNFTGIKDYSFYQIDDSIPVSKYLYTIQKLDPFGQFVVLTQSGVNRGTGVSTNFFAKNIVSSDINSHKQIDLLKLRGQYVLLDFWGTWCIPCKQTLPKLRSIDSLYSRNGLRLISIAYDKDEETVRSATQEDGMIWINLFQSMYANAKANNLILDYKVTTYPTTILIDPKGKIIYRGDGIAGIEKINQLIKTLF